MDAILRIENVEQAFRTGFWMKRTTVLHGVSLAVPRRSIFGFVGANGAGKTTLIHLIVGIRKPQAGGIWVANHAAQSIEARSQIGYLPERPYFYEHLTGEGLLHYFGALSGMSRSEIDSRIPSALADVGMSHARHQELRKYSKGMLQRIGVAQAILHNPEFLVLDEPMSGLDPVGRREMRELILKLASEGRTIFFSTHVIPDVEAICDQVAMIQKGRIIGCGPISGFLDQGGVQQTEVVFSGMSSESAKNVHGLGSFRAVPEGMRALIPLGKDVNEALRGLLDRGGKILWVNPVRPSLESLFESTMPTKEQR